MQTSIEHDAEIAGLFVGALYKWENAPEPGSASWAAQQEILSRYGSRVEYEAYLEDLPDGSLAGYLSNLKGHAFERWLEYHGEMVGHEVSNFAGSDGVSPSTGGLIEAKAGSTKYIDAQRALYDSDIEMHTTVEGTSVTGAIAHDIPEAEFENALTSFAEDADMLGDLLQGSLAFGALLSAAGALSKLQAGEIHLLDTPRAFAIPLAGKTARTFVIGTAVATGQPVLVATGAGWLALKNRKALERIAQSIRYVLSNPTTKRVVSQATSATTHHGWRATKGASKLLFAAAGHSATRRSLTGAAMVVAKGASWTARLALPSAKALVRKTFGNREP